MGEGGGVFLECKARQGKARQGKARQEKQMHGRILEHEK